MTDEEASLLARVNKKDEEAIKVLFDKYYKAIVVGFQKRGVQVSDAKDAAQHAFIKLFRTRKKINSINHLKNLLFKVANNKLIDDHRQKLRHDENIEKILEALYPEFSEAEQERAEIRASFLQKKLDELPPEQKQVMQLAHCDGLDNEEVAEKMGINYQKVANIKTRVLKWLKKKLLFFS